MKKVFIYGTYKKIKNYIIALKKANICAVVGKDLTNALNCDGLILVGGGDILPKLYSKDITCSEVDFKRDISELLLIENYFAKNLPILGICKGMQIINVAFGGTLENITNSDISHSAKIGDALHTAYNLNGFTKKLYGSSFTVNSAHKQRISMLANCLKVCSISSDNTIEAIEHKNKPIFGVQFHPERMNNGQNIYDFFSKVLNSL